MTDNGKCEMKRGKLRFVSAGNPPPLLFHPNGEYEQLDCAGLPLGCMDGASYEETVAEIRPSDCLL